MIEKGKIAKVQSAVYTALRDHPMVHQNEVWSGIAEVVS